MDETFFSEGIYLFMCLLPMVTCILTGIPTVQSYDKVSVPARGFRPAVPPSCSLVCVRARMRIAVDAGHPLVKGL